MTEDATYELNRRLVDENAELVGQAVALRAELQQANDSNQIWQDVAKDCCEAAGVEGWSLVRVPDVIRALRAELAQVKDERDAALQLVDDTLAALGASDATP